MDVFFFLEECYLCDVVFPFFIAFCSLARRLEAAASAPRRYSSVPTSNLNSGWRDVSPRLQRSRCTAKQNRDASGKKKEKHVSSVRRPRQRGEHQTHPSAFGLGGTHLFTHTGAKQKGLPIRTRKPACHYPEDSAESTASARSNLSSGDQGV